MERVTCLGTLFALEISVPESKGYGSTETASLVQILRQRGLHIRPIGNVLYLMVSVLTSRDDANSYLAIIRDGLNQWFMMNAKTSDFRYDSLSLEQQTLI